MTKKEFKNLTGENAEDLLGDGWEDTMEEYISDNSCTCGGVIGGFGEKNIACMMCKMD